MHLTEISNATALTTQKVTKMIFHTDYLKDNFAVVGAPTPGVTSLPQAYHQRHDTEIHVAKMFYFRQSLPVTKAKQYMLSTDELEEGCCLGIDLPVTVPFTDFQCFQLTVCMCPLEQLLLWSNASSTQDAMTSDWCLTAQSGSTTLKSLRLCQTRTRSNIQ